MEMFNIYSAFIYMNIIQCALQHFQRSSQLKEKVQYDTPVPPDQNMW